MYADLENITFETGTVGVEVFDCHSFDMTLVIVVFDSLDAQISVLVVGHQLPNRLFSKSDAHFVHSLFDG